MIIIGLASLRRKISDHTFRYVKQVDLDCIEGAGGTPLLLPLISSSADAEVLVRHLQGLLLLGGGDLSARLYGGPESSHVKNMYAARDESELLLVKAAIKQEIPILAICRGCQLLNVALGGTLIQDIPSQWPGSILHNSPDGTYTTGAQHDITIVSGSILERIFERTDLHVNSYHHQALDRVGEGLVVTANTSDGVVEGVELKEYPFCIGVQWHPEKPEMNKESMRPLFQAFVKAAEKQRPQAG